MNKTIYLVILGTLLATCAFGQCNQPYQKSQDGKCLYLCHDNPIFQECVIPNVEQTVYNYKVCGFKNGAYQEYSSACQACKSNAYGYYSGDCTCTNIVCHDGESCLNGNCIDKVNSCGTDNKCVDNVSFCADDKCVILDYEACTADPGIAEAVCNNKAGSKCTHDKICTVPSPPNCQQSALPDTPYIPCKQEYHDDYHDRHDYHDYHHGYGHKVLTCSAGACMPYKGPACLTNQAGVYQCPLAQQTCYSGTCYPTSSICGTKLCPEGQTCDDAATPACKIPCGAVPFCDVGQICQANTKCIIPCGTTTCDASTSKCVNDMCVKKCANNGECADTQLCADIDNDSGIGYCAVKCPNSVGSTTICQPLQTCLDDLVCQIVCDMPNHPCPKDYTCQKYNTHYICVQTTCDHNLANPKCPTNYKCYKNDTCVLESTLCGGTQICKQGYTCIDDVCAIDCTTFGTSVCPRGQTCQSNVCADFTCDPVGTPGDGVAPNCPIGYTCVLEATKKVCIATPLVCGTVTCQTGQVCNTDKKCVAKCGTKECKVGQKCQAGVCSTFCATGVYCGPTQKCIAGSCYSQCGTTKDCKFGEMCNTGGCMGQACTYPQDCTGSQNCVAANCVASYCSDQSKCPAGYTCTDDKQCLPTTQVCGRTICTDGQQCQAGKCVPISNYCINDRVCQPGNQCRGNRCVPALCGNQYCAQNQICSYGYCLDPCSLMTCPWKYKCEKGACVPNQSEYSPAPQYCNHYVACLGDYICRDNQCVSRYDDRPPQYCNQFMPCPGNYRCFNYKCVANTSPGPIRYCNQFTNCGINYQCVANQCVPINQPPTPTVQTCSYANPCPAGSTCQANICISNRIKCPANPCPLNYTCINNLCQTLEKGAFCSTIRQCQTGQVCVGNVCRKLVCYNDYDCFGYTCSSQGQCIANSY